MAGRPTIPKQRRPPSFNLEEAKLYKSGMKVKGRKESFLPNLGSWFGTIVAQEDTVAFEGEEYKQSLTPEQI